MGAVAQAKEESWRYALPEMAAPVKTVAVGIDGTCMLLTQSGWREAMVGTLSLYDRKGERLHTIQMGATPEYGKKSFYAHFDRELEQVKKRYPKALFIGIADGARSNWDYLKPRTNRQSTFGMRQAIWAGRQPRCCSQESEKRAQNGNGLTLRATN